MRWQPPSVAEHAASLVGMVTRWSLAAVSDQRGGSRWTARARLRSGYRAQNGPGWEAAVLEAYGADPDPVRTEFYRALWDRSGLT